MNEDKVLALTRAAVAVIDTVSMPPLHACSAGVAASACRHAWRHSLLGMLLSLLLVLLPLLPLLEGAAADAAGAGAVSVAATACLRRQWFAAASLQHGVRRALNTCGGLPAGQAKRTGSPRAGARTSDSAAKKRRHALPPPQSTYSHRWLLPGHRDTRAHVRPPCKHRDHRACGLCAVLIGQRSSCYNG